jgi:hypothetical protein
MEDHLWDFTVISMKLILCDSIWRYLKISAVEFFPKTKRWMKMKSGMTTGDFLVSILLIGVDICQPRIA